VFALSIEPQQQKTAVPQRQQAAGAAAVPQRQQASARPVATGCMQSVATRRS